MADKMTDKEIREAKSLRWLAFQFPKVENPKDDVDRMQNCINLYCTNAADLLQRQQAEIERLMKLLDHKCDLCINRNKVKGIKEFWEKLWQLDPEIISKVVSFDLDELNNLKKEMVGEDK